MFTKKIIDSDAFLEMPCSAQALYFHLCMRADDDGFVNNTQKIKRVCGASGDDLKLLLAKRFILAFDNGIIVIKHWRMHNLLRKDRYAPTQYIEEMDKLMLKPDGSYTEKTEEIPMATTWQPTGNQLATQYSIVKGSLVKDSVVEGSIACATTTAATQIIKDWGNGVIRLTDTEREDLFKKLGADHFKTYINKLASFITGKGASVSNHYGTVLKWYEEDKAKGKVKSRYGSFDPNDAMQRAIDRSYRKDTNDDE